MGTLRLSAGLAALGVTLGIGLAGCGAGGGGTAQGASGGVVTIGYENAPDPEAVAIEQHFFQHYMHAKVKLEYFSSGPAALTSLASGSLDFMTTLGNPPTASAIARGVPLKVIWAMERYTTGEGLVVKKSSGITSLQGLEGKTVALVKGSTSPFELDTALSLAGIPLSKVTQQNYSPPEMVAAWKTGNLQAAYVWTPFDNAMQQSGGRFIMYDQNVYKEAPIFNLAVVNSNWANSHKTLVEEFVRAEEAGVQFFHQHPNQSYKDMGALNSISASAAKAQTTGFYFESLQSQVGPLGLGQGSSVSTSLVTKSLTSAAKWLAKTGQISSAPSNMAQYVDPSYAQAVLNGK